MSVFLIATLFASAADDGLEVYKCQNLKTQQNFVMSYETKGSRVSDVELYVDGVPRLDKDDETRWRGKKIEGGIAFTYSNVRNRAGTSGNMTLLWQSADDHKARLTWTSITGGGHVWLEEQEKTADCALSIPEADVSK